MIDVIVPVYNTDIGIISRCINSIKDNTYTDYKVYFINDGSNSNIENFLNLVCKCNDNFKVIDIKKNQGVSYARNVGLEKTNSKYLTFIDSDDEISNTFLEDSIKILEDYNLDLVIGGSYKIEDGKAIEKKCREGLHIYDYTKMTLLKEDLLTDRFNLDSTELGSVDLSKVHSRVFRRDSINKLKFKDYLRDNEDTIFMLDYFSTDPKVGITDKIWYNYYKKSPKLESDIIYKKMAFTRAIHSRMCNEENGRVKNAYKMRGLMIGTEIRDVLEYVGEEDQLDYIINEQVFRRIYDGLDVSCFQLNVKEQVFYDKYVKDKISKKSK